MISVDERESESIYAAYRAKAIVSSPDLERVAATIADPRFPGALIPLDRQADTLCAAAATLLDWCRLAPLLDARIGYELSDFPGPVRSDTPAQRVLEVLDGYVPVLWCLVRLPPDPNRHKAAVAGCARLVSNVAEHASLMELPRPMRGTAELLAGFEAALDQRDFDVGADILRELRVRDLLDGLNVRSLRLRLLYERGERLSPEFAELARQLREIALPFQVRALLEDLP